MKDGGKKRGNANERKRQKEETNNDLMNEWLHRQIKNDLITMRGKIYGKVSQSKGDSSNEEEKNGTEDKKKESKHEQVDERATEERSR